MFKNFHKSNIIKQMNNYHTVSIQFTKSDADKLTEKAKQNRLKLSSYLRYVITKNLSDD